MQTLIAEVDKYTEFEIERSQISFNLVVILACEIGLAFDFKNDFVVDDEVDSISSYRRTISVRFHYVFS